MIFSENRHPLFGIMLCGLLRLAPGPRLLLQHDRNAVADRIGEAGLFRDQLLFLRVISERHPLPRADQQLQELAVDAAGRTVGIAHGFAPDDRVTYSMRASVSNPKFAHIKRHILWRISGCRDTSNSMMLVPL